MEQNVTLYQAKKSAVEIRRELLNVPQVAAALEPLEMAVFKAAIGKTFGEYTKEELGRALAESLTFISRDVGYRDSGDGARGYLIIRLCEILRIYYPGFTMQDFRKAFEMCIAGELDDYLPKSRDGQAERGHYQNFSAEYVCKILNAYKIKRARILAKAADAVPEQGKPIEQKELIRLRNQQKRIFFELLGAYRENGALPANMMPSTEIVCSGLLAQYGLMPEIEVTEAEQREVWQREINRFARMGNVGDMERIKNAGHTDANLQNKAFTLARRKELVKALERIVTEGIDVESIIKFE